MTSHAMWWNHWPQVLGPSVWRMKGGLQLLLDGRWSIAGHRECCWCRLFGRGIGSLTVGAERLPWQSCGSTGIGPLSIRLDDNR